VRGKNIIVTGGSSGIGLATAELLIKKGAGSIAIIARNQELLDKAKAQLEQLAAHSKNATTTAVYAYSADVSNEAAMNAAVEQYVKSVGTIDAVIASAGVTNPDYFENLPVSEFERLMRINYIGAVVTTKAVVPYMKKQALGGRLIFISSMAGLAGIFGYSAYSPTKYAIRGFAEVVAMELKPYKIYVSVSNPPDVDTPMYAQENKTKPLECKLISEGTGVFPAERLAHDIVKGLEKYRFFIQTGFDGFMLGLLTAGFNPSANLFTAVMEILFMSPMRLVAIVTRFSYNQIVSKVRAERAIKGKSS